MSYPTVAGEFETVAKIADGFSIARFGDGEVKLMEKYVYTRELKPVPKLAAELRAIIFRPHPKCLIGIPTMDPAGDRYQNWLRHKARFARNFPKGRKYYSAFITRPDCGTAWLETRDYYEAVCAIWRDKRRIACVSEADSKLLAYLRLGAAEVVHVECPMYGAYSAIGRLETEVVRSGCDLAVLSCGPTATALAHRLATRGLHAVDLGSIGGFLLRWHRGSAQPADYAQERANGPDAYA